MGNTLYDKLKLMHDIEERQEIVNRYQFTMLKLRFIGQNPAGL